MKSWYFIHPIINVLVSWHICSNILIRHIKHIIIFNVGKKYLISGYMYKLKAITTNNFGHHTLSLWNLMMLYNITMFCDSFWFFIVLLLYDWDNFNNKLELNKIKLSKIMLVASQKRFLTVSGLKVWKRKKKLNVLRFTLERKIYHVVSIFEIQTVVVYVVFYYSYTKPKDYIMFQNSPLGNTVNFLRSISEYTSSYILFSHRSRIL